MTENKLKEYAQLIIEVGVNLQKGQDMLLVCPIELAYFARLVAKAAYERGAREVVYHWGDDELDRLRYRKAADEVFAKLPQWQTALYEEYTHENAVRVMIRAGDPENLKGLDSQRIQRQALATANGMRKYFNLQISSVISWCIVSLPLPAWAIKVFPKDSEEQAMEKLWAAILETVRVKGEGNAIASWRQHIALLKERSEKLNNLKLKKLHYKNDLGTDLTVELPKGHIWSGGEGKTQSGTAFVANMPTEEVATVPKRDGVNGILKAAMPLVLNGQLITDLEFEFEAGKIVKAYSSTGQDLLENQLAIDEGARYLGEVALVPYDSPISRQNILYYHTLFDENASCHFAFGKAYPAIENAKDMTAEELFALGVNDSLIHVDFMVGTKDLSITATTEDGQEVEIFIDGNFAF